MTLFQRPVLALLVGLLSFAAAQGPGAACTVGPDAACDKGHYCAAAVGACDGAGACAVAPEMCPQDFAPVCGCDDNTYSNDCDAISNGVNVASTGACAVAGAGAAGGPGACKAGTCDEGSFCKMATGQCEGSKGECVVASDVCNKMFDPVCGCDGNDYNNECLAHEVSVSVASRGACGSVRTEDVGGHADWGGGFNTTAGCEEKCDGVEEGAERCDSDAFDGCRCVFNDPYCFSECDAGTWRMACAGAAPPLPAEPSTPPPTKAPTPPPTKAPAPPPTDADPDLPPSAGRRSAPLRFALGAGLSLALALGFGR